MDTKNNIIQWNLRGMGSAKEEVMQLIEAHKPSVLALQETFYGNDFMSKINNYNGVCKQGHYNRRFQGGVALYIHSSLPYTSIDIQTELQIVAVRVQINYTRTITIASIYLPPRENIQQQHLEQILPQLPSPFLLLGDFNAHHPTWDATSCDNRGRMIISFITNNNLICHNNIEPTHISGSSIDLSLSSSEIGCDIDWNVLPTVLSSDHYPILINISGANPLFEITRRYNYKAAKWKQYYVDPIWENLPVADDLSPNEIFADVMQRFQIAADRNIPVTSSHKYFPRTFWNDECKHVWCERERLYRQYKACKLPEVKTQWQRARAIAKRTFRRCKQQSFQEYLSNMKYGTRTSQIYNKLRNIRGRPPRQIHFLNNNNKTHTTTKDIANCLGHSFSEISNYNNHTDYFKTRRLQWESKVLNFSSDNNEQYNNIFSLHELKAVLATCPNTSPGPDQITYKMIKELPDSMLTYIVHMFNIFWKLGFFPEEWRKATVYGILKPDKPRSDPLSYRPIALTSCLCKTFEKLINRRLVEYLEMNKLLSDKQCGFRKSRSTIDHLTRLDTYIRKAFASDMVTIGIFFDLEKAYDTTWRYGIMDDIHNLGLRGRLPIYIGAFLERRKFQVAVGNSTSDEFEQTAGVPQGSILSVTLFSIKINSIANIIPPDIHASLFVDDLQLTLSGYNLAETVEKLQPVIDNIYKWANNNGFKFSSSKTNCMVFHKRPSYVGIPKFKLNNALIPVKPLIKFLGLIWDSQLNWKGHINKIKADCTKSLNLLRILSSNSAGADQHTLLQTYRLVIRPKIDYGCIIYGSAPQSALSELDSVHNEALRICSGSFRSSPVESLYVLLDEPSLTDRRTNVSLRYYYKMKCFLLNPARHCLVDNNLKIFFNSRNYATKPIISRTHSAIEELNLPTGPVFPHKTATMFTHTIFRPHVDTSLAINFIKTVTDFHHPFIEYTNEKYPNYIHIYTDGSKSQRGVGAAAVSRTQKKMATLPRAASIYTAEIHALKLACQIIKEDPAKLTTNYLICSDSLGAVRGLVTGDPRNTLMSRIQLIFHELLFENVGVVILWIPAHQNIHGNIKADEAAGRASTGLPTLIPLPYTDFFPLINMAILKKWDERWQTKNTQLREIQPHPVKLNNINITRKQEIMLNRLRIGHTRLTHGYLMDQDVPIRPSCLWCNEPLSVKHIFLTCPQISHYRNFFFSHLPHPLSLSSILGDDAESIHIFGFLNALGIGGDI